jgi:uncharacterized protein (DUF2236 family)
MGTARPCDEAERAELEGYFGPESVTWRVARERALVLGGGRAVLMQLAHPLVAAGVGQHSAYASEPWARAFATLDLTQRTVFGTRREAREAARHVNRLHAGVTGTLDVPAGAYVASTSYRARQPDLLLWVFATLVDTARYMYPLVVGPLSEADWETYYQESKRSVRLLGLPEKRIPPTLADLDVYVAEMLNNDALAATLAAHAVARAVLRMPVPFVLRPAFALGGEATIGWLPERLREIYGLTWDDRRQRLLDAGMAGLRRVLPAVPAVLRYNVWAQRAYRRVAAMRWSVGARKAG